MQANELVPAHPPRAGQPPCLEAELQVGLAVTQQPGTLQASAVAEQVPHERGWQAPQQRAPALPELQVPKKPRVPLQLQLQALAPPGAQETLEFFFQPRA